MDVELARTFLAIVAAGSFVRAAERLHISQTAVSARVRSLEEQLRTPLFIRNKSGATLTAAGERFLRRAPALVQLWERARHEVAVPAGRRGVIAIGAELSLWDPLLLRWLLWMRREAPDLALRAEVGQADTLMDQVTEGILDLAVLYAPRHRAGLRVELLAEERLVLVKAAPPPDAADQPGFVEVDWGPDITLPRSDGAEGSEPSVRTGFGPLGLGFILATGGCGYFRMSAVRAHVEKGSLDLVAGAPEFLHPAYVAYGEASDEGLLRTALDGLRAAVARGEGAVREIERG